MHRWCICALAPLVTALAACRPSPVGDVSWPEARPLGAALEAYRPPAAGQGDAIELPDDPTGDLSLADAMALALLRNPSLRAFAYDVRAAEARILHAERLPNPEFEAEVENIAGSGAFEGIDAAEVTLSLAQTLPLGGDIQRRRERAGHEAALAGWDYEAARVEVLTDVTRRYVEVLVAQRELDAAREALSLAEQVRDLTHRRVEAGDAAPIELPRTAVPVIAARVEAARAQRAVASARRRLAVTWGQTEPGFGELHGDLDAIAPVPALAALRRHLDRHRSVAGWASELGARRAAAHVARAEAAPDLTARLGYRFDNDTDDSALVLGVALPLPLFDRRTDDIAATRQDIAAAHQRQAAARQRAAMLLAEAHAQLIDAHELATAVRDEALPAAGEAFDATRLAFERGELTFIDVIDAQRTLIDLRGRYIAALRAYHTAAAEVEGLIAAPIASIDVTEPSHDQQTGDALP